MVGCGISAEAEAIVMVTQLTIVGGGITGLAAAFIAARQGCKVTVLESSHQFGGLLNTFEIGGTRLEYYYHHFFTHDAEINWLLGELGLTNAVVFAKTTMGVFRDGQIFNLNGLVDLLKFKPVGFLGKARFVCTSLYLGKIADWRKWEHVSCLDWFYRYAGKEVTDSLWKPLLVIKFGPYFAQIPVTWMIGRLAQRMNSRKGGDERLGYLKGSLHVLLERLLDNLSTMRVELIEDAPVEAVNIVGNRLESIQTPKGRFGGGPVLFTLPTIYLEPILRHAGVNELADRLAPIEYFGAVCVILEMTHPLSHVYWLNIADAGFPFGGVIEQTNFVPPADYQGRHIAYLSRYFSHAEPIAKMSHEEVKGHMLATLPQVFPNFRQEHLKAVYVFRTNTAATVCDLGFSRKVPPCRTEVENLFLCNMCHIYPDERSCNNSIRIAAEALRVIGLDTAMVPRHRSFSGNIGF